MEAFAPANRSTCAKRTASTKLSRSGATIPKPASRTSEKIKDYFRAKYEYII